jgi:thiamine-phosphate pyrophosphorylase
MPEPEFIKEAKKIKTLTDAYHIPFIINDNIDVAMAMDAGGVHVGQNDMDARDVRKWSKKYFKN